MEFSNFALHVIKADDGIISRSNELKAIGIKDLDAMTYRVRRKW